MSRHTHFSRLPRHGGLLIVLVILVIWAAYFGESRLGAKSAYAALVEPCQSGAVLWANAEDQAPTLRVEGKKHTFVGNLHSNHTVLLGGEQHQISGVVSYVTSFEDTGQDNSYYALQQVVATRLPTQLDSAAFQPGGSIAQAAESAGEYHYITGNLEVGDGDQLADGLYYVTGNVNLKVRDRVGRLTIIAEGTIRADLRRATLDPAVGGLLFVANAAVADANAVDVKLRESLLRGLVYAPAGPTKIDGRSALLFGLVVAERIDVRGVEFSVIDSEELCHLLAAAPTPAATPSATVTETPIPGATPTPTFTSTPTVQPGPSATDLPLATPAATATPEATATPTVSPAPSPTSTLAPTAPPQPVLQVNKVDYLWGDGDEDGQLSPGDILLYAISVSNLGSSTVTDLRIRDLVDGGATLVPGSVQSDQGEVLMGNDPGDREAVVAVAMLAVGANLQVGLRAMVNPSSGPIRLENQAEVTFNDGATGGAGPHRLLSDDPDTPAPADPTVSQSGAMPTPLFLPLVTKQ